MPDPTAYVDEARTWAIRLTAREYAGYGDLLPAMRRLARRLGLRSWWDLWSLHYRPPKRIFADVYVPLKLAYEAECERQRKLADGAKERVLQKLEAFEEKHETDASSGDTDTSPDLVAMPGRHRLGPKHSSAESNQDDRYASESEAQGVP